MSASNNHQISDLDGIKEVLAVHRHTSWPRQGALRKLRGAHVCGASLAACDQLRANLPVGLIKVK